MIVKRQWLKMNIQTFIAGVSIALTSMQVSASELLMVEEKVQGHVEHIGLARFGQLEILC